jgi:hypothetical protein
MSEVLVFPKVQSMGFSNALINLCHRARTSTAEEVVFDLSKTEFITPFGLVLLSGTISECLAQQKIAKYKKPDKHATWKFLSGIGFNKFFQLSSDAGHKIESPMVQLKRLKQIDYFLTDQILDVFKYSIRMTTGVEGSLKLALNELMTNVFDHSESGRGCYVCAQSYRQSKKIRLCIADFGIGILASLRNIPNYSFLQNDYDAIKLSVKEGITSRIGIDAGYGLTHIQRFIRVNKGKMCILSGKGKILWDFTGIKAKERRPLIREKFQGSIIELEINAAEEGLYFLKSEVGQIF